MKNLHRCFSKCVIVACLTLSSTVTYGQEFQPASANIEVSEFVSTSTVARSSTCTSDIMDTSNFRLIDYRRMFKTGRTPTPAEMQGRWRGVNKGIVNLAGYNQFIKEIGHTGDCCFGDNIKVHQVSNEVLRCFGWHPKIDDCGQIEREGKFRVQSSSVRPGIGNRPFRHGAVLSYRDGGNGHHNAANLLVDRVVMLDCNHMLGRATAKFGPIHIPLAYFVLERIVE